MAELNRSLTMLVFGPSKAGKAVCVDTPILTDNRGFVSMGDIKEGDTVFSADGSPTEVVAVSDVMDDRQVYRVRMKSGAVITADAEHQWAVRDKNGLDTIKTTQDLYERLVRAGRSTHRVPVSGVVQFTESLTAEELPIDPYVLGVWLGDGKSAGNEWGMQTSDFHIVASEMVRRGQRLGAHTPHTVADAVYTSLRGVLPSLRDLNLIKNKHIPLMYLTADEQSRRSLLAGLLDSDGGVHTNPETGTTQIVFGQRDGRLLDDVTTLVRSLGAKASVKHGTGYKARNGRLVWTASQEDEWFFLPRKQQQLMRRSPKTGATNYDLIVEVAPSESVPVKCLQVAHPSGLFLAGTELTVTHNSTLAATSPGPRLILDVENGAKFLDVKATVWDPNTEEPPKDDGTWDTCIVHVREYSVVPRAYQWLLSGQHPFRSVVIDSISELQAKALEEIAGRKQMETRDWGALLREMTGFMRDMRDLTTHPTNPLECVILTAMAKEDTQGRFVPYLQGQAGTIVSYLLDVTGYLSVETFPHPDPAQGRYSARRLYVCCTDKALAGERVGGRLGTNGIVEQDDLNVANMIDVIYGERKNSAATVAAVNDEETA